MIPFSNLSGQAKEIIYKAFFFLLVQICSEIYQDATCRARDDFCNCVYKQFLFRTSVFKIIRF